MEHKVNVETIYAALCQVQTFLRPFLGLANTHGAEFLSEDHWSCFVSPAVQSKLLGLSNEDLVNLSLLNILETSESEDISCMSSPDVGSGEVPKETGKAVLEDKVENLSSFISQAQSCHLERLGVLTPLKSLVPNQLLSDFENPFSVISEAMCEKKIHEVGIMVDTVATLYKTTYSDLIVDVGSGKGYFASEMSLKYKIPVIGFDSRDTNTHGASQRDRKLAKKWADLERRKRFKQLDDCQDSTPSTAPPTTISKNENSSGKPAVTDSKPKAFAVTETQQGSGTECGENKGHFLPNKPQHCTLYSPVTLYVHPKMNLCKVIQEEIPLYKTLSSPRLLLSGLHTCGSLAVTTTNLFLQDPNAVALCCVGCCYQLMDELWPSVCTNIHDKHSKTQHSDACQEHHFPISAFGKGLGLKLGRNARNLASQSVHRIRASGQLQGGDFFWRALLNILFLELGFPIPERIVGMRGLNKNCSTFYDYAAAAMKKLGFSNKLPEQHKLANLEARYKEACTRMSAFFQLKLVLAPVIEALILLDRLAFLFEQESVTEAHLVQLFDPVLSPRCYALIAWKRNSKMETLLTV